MHGGYLSTDAHLILIDERLEGEVHALLCVPEVYHYLADGQAPPREIATSWCAASRKDWDEYGGGLWGLRGVTHALAGLVQISNLEADTAELTYLLHPDEWGSGLATRMAHTAIMHCFSQSVVKSVRAGADQANKASVAVMQRLGMAFRRNVDYPNGPGVEYMIGMDEYDEGQFEPLSVVR